MYNEGIQLGIDNDFRNDVIARKIYLSFPTNAFVGKEEIEFEVFNQISNYFKTPINNIHVVGSAKTGFSYVKNKKFKLGESDLDIAIIDKDLFIQYSEIVLRETKGFKDFSQFGRTRGGDDEYIIYKDYLTRGIFRPDLMPKCEAKTKWFAFFNKLSGNYFELFSNINAGIYLTHKFFETKQSDNIDFYKKI